ncbi:MAG TPA: hypothetical protein VG167_10855 [Verrucomicrobiae bacterium]|nr:hypothetical protein [Verrucomicrobiae bacterium]
MFLKAFCGSALLALSVAASPTLQLHWTGSRNLHADTNAAYLKTILDLPQSTTLKNQTLDKLALWLARAPGYPALQQSNTPALFGAMVATNAAAKALRPLLDDLVEEESYFELQSGTNGPTEFAMAVRLDPAQAALWETNLASAFGPAPHLPFSLQPLAFSLRRAAPWTLVSLSSATNHPLLDALADRIQSAGANNPFTASSTTNFWVDLSLDFAQLSALWSSPKTPTLQHSNTPGLQQPNFPLVSLRAYGDGTDVHILGDATFPRPLPLELEPWNIPTNLIHDPLISFTAARGFRPLLTNWPAWKSLQLPSSPNQVFVWALRGVPIQDFAAAPLTNADGAVRVLGNDLMRFANAALAERRFGGFEFTNADELIWRGAPFISPSVRSISDQRGQVLLAGLVHLPEKGLVPPPELWNQVFSRTNLVYYGWELTGPRLEQWLYLTQLARVLAHQPQMPPASPGLEWLDGAAPRFGNCITIVTDANPQFLHITRRCKFGLTSIEFHVLVDWLESAAFPCGFHTLTAAPAN